MHAAFYEAYKIYENKQACLSKTLSGEHLGLKHSECSIQLLAEKYKVLYQNTKIMPSKQSIWYVLRRNKHTQHAVKRGWAKIISVKRGEQTGLRKKSAFSLSGREWRKDMTWTTLS